MENQDKKFECTHKYRLSSVEALLNLFTRQILGGITVVSLLNSRAKCDVKPLLKDVILVLNFSLSPARSHYKTD